MNGKNHTGGTIAAISTGQAPGGIGVVRISGPQALKIGERVFHSAYGRSLEDLRGYTAALGEIRNAQGKKLDDCVALVFRGPKSYTGEDVVEFSCHGGLYLTRQVLSAVLEAGAKPAGPGEFTRRAFLNGKMDLAQSEAVMELIGAAGDQAAALARAAEDGALTKKILKITESLEDLAAHLTAWIDFPEEDVEEATVAQAEQVLRDCEFAVEKLLKGFEKGKIVREGLRTVIAGKPNVGKSTLMNLLVGGDRSIVTPYAGTTRDVIEERVLLAGVPLLLADTAGIRETEDPIEEFGVAASRKRLETAQLVLLVFDGSQELQSEDFELIAASRHVPVVGIVNKCDLENKIDLGFLKANFSHWVQISAGSGQGLEELERVLSDLLGTGELDFTDGELFTDRQYSAALLAMEAFREARDAIALGMPLDAVTVCVEDGLRALYELTGQKVSDEVVDRVFERFCVGK